jgi:hypothetical protein
MSIFCPFCPEAIYLKSDSSKTVRNEDLEITEAIDTHISFHEHFLFSCGICQKKM